MDLSIVSTRVMGDKISNQWHTTQLAGRFWLADWVELESYRNKL